MNATATAHGMGKERVSPDWPPLLLEELRPVLHLFPACGEPEEILSISPRPFSAASVVSTSAGRVFVKRHHPLLRDCEGLREEHRFLQHLASKGASVPEVLATLSGDTAVVVNGWTWEIHSVFAGHDIYADALSWTPFLSRPHAFSAGAALAHLHLAAVGFDAPARQPRPLVSSFSIYASNDPLQALHDYLAQRPVLANHPLTHRCFADAHTLLQPFAARLQPLLPDLLPLWTHNDMHASNLLWSNAGADAEATSILDFGLADRTTAVHDLALMIERNVVEWLDLDVDSPQSDNAPIHPDHLHAILDGYHAIRPLSAAERTALAPMTALCHAEFALTEADYFATVLHQEENIRICLEDYLVGHALWFRGPGGTRLLSAIDAWAAQTQ